MLGAKIRADRLAQLSRQRTIGFASALFKGLDMLTWNPRADLNASHGLPQASRRARRRSSSRRSIVRIALTAIGSGSPPIPRVLVTKTPSGAPRGSGSAGVG